MKTLIFGAGNLLLSDEGFGVHFIRHLERHYQFPEEIELLDAGTLGLFATHELEAADRVYMVDVLDAPGPPGTVLRFAKDDFMLNRVPVKLSPHQIGVQEMLLHSELRGRCPSEIFLLGVIPATFDPGCDLSPALRQCLPQLAEELVNELRQSGLDIIRNPTQVT